MATEDRTSEFLALAQELEASGLGSGSASASASGSASGSGAAGSAGGAIGGGKPSPPYPMSRAPTGIHDNTSTGTAANSKMRGRYGDTTTNDNDPSDPTNELRQFHQTASTISQDIATTSAMLQELTSLVRRRNLFVDDSDRINWLVLRIKTSIQSLDGRLDEAAAVIARNKRRLGRNSQRGEEMNNLGQTLKENYEEIGLGFKSLLEERSVRMKDDAERRKAVNAGDVIAADGSGGHGGSAALNSRPLVYGDSGAGGSGSGSGSGSGAADERDRDALPGRSGGFGGGGNSFLGGPGGGIGGGGGGSSVGPMLDLTSAVRMSSSTGNTGPSTNVQGAGEPSNEYLPRPHGGLGDFGAESPNGMRLRHSSSEPMNEYSGGTSSLYGRSGSGSGSGSGLNAMNNYSEHGTPGAGAGGGSRTALTPLEIMRQESEAGQGQMMQLIPDQSYLQERADVMETVESHMLELGNVFNKLAVMVHEHRDMVQRVEDNVDDAHDTINLSLAQLTDTLENLRTNRTLALKVFAVIVVFIILFITFFA